MPNYKILLVDDEEYVLKTLERTLNDENYSIIKAESGEKALEIIDNNPKIDLIISDFKMP
ncbi:MAG: response regulator [Pseudomonadota bacterium]